jgi:hypothetical protein
MREYPGKLANSVIERGLPLQIRNGLCCWYIISNEKDLTIDSAWASAVLTMHRSCAVKIHQFWAKPDPRRKSSACI